MREASEAAAVMASESGEDREAVGGRESLEKTAANT